MSTACRFPRRGFTLLEVMVTLAVGSILGVGFLSAALYQQRTALVRQSDAAAYGQAQTVLLALQSAADRAGFGFGHANDAVGLAPTGWCSTGSSFAGNWVEAAPTARCRGVDNGGASDRLRFTFADPWLFSYPHPSRPSAGPCVGGGTSVASLHLAERGQAADKASTMAGLPANVPLIIGGDCQGGGSPSAASDHLRLVNAAGTSGDGCWELRTFQRRLPSTGASNALSCPNGYAAGYSLAVAEALEFYTDVDADSGLPRLMMAQQSWGQPPVPVAVGVTRFEVRYGFDTSGERDNKLHACPTCTDDPYGARFGGPYSWCREMRAADAGGSCQLSDASGNALDTGDLQARVVAVHVTFDIVSPGVPSAVVKAKGLSPGASKWTFRTTLFLPNAAL